MQNSIKIYRQYLSNGIKFNQYGECQVFTDFKNKKFYPAEYSKEYIKKVYEHFGVELEMGE